MPERKPISRLSRRPKAPSRFKPAPVTPPSPSACARPSPASIEIPNWRMVSPRSTHSGAAAALAAKPKVRTPVARAIRRAIVRTKGRTPFFCVVTSRILPPSDADGSAKRGERERKAGRGRTSLSSCYEIRRPMDLGLRLAGKTPASSAVLSEADALDRPLTWDAELTISEVTTAARVIGAFQRGQGMPTKTPLMRRISGGAPVCVGPGTIHVALALRSPSVLFPIDARKLINRYVRPLLRALTKSGASAAYFGRDWISVEHRPAAIVGFAHDGGTGRAVFEAFVALRTPFLGARSAFLGKEPGTLESLLGRAFDAAVVAKAIADAYLALAGGVARELVPHPVVDTTRVDEALRAEPPWAARVEEVIGPVCAG